MVVCLVEVDAIWDVVVDCLVEVVVCLVEVVVFFVEVICGFVEVGNVLTKVIGGLVGGGVFLVEEVNDLVEVLVGRLVDVFVVVVFFGVVGVGGFVGAFVIWVVETIGELDVASGVVGDIVVGVVVLTEIMTDGSFN